MAFSMFCASTWSRLPDKKDWHFRQLLNNKNIPDVQDTSMQDNLVSPRELLFQGDGKRQVSTFLGVCTTQSKDATLSSPCVEDGRVYQLLFIVYKPQSRVLLWSDPLNMYSKSCFTASFWTELRWRETTEIATAVTVSEPHRSQVLCNISNNHTGI